MQTTVYAVRDELVTRFTGYVAGMTDPPPVYFGHPGKQTLGDRYVSVGSTVAEVGREVRRLPHDANASTDERYELQVVLWSLIRGRQDSDASRQAALDVVEMFDALSLGLRSSQDDWSLGGLVTTATFGSYTPDDYVDLNEGRASQIAASVAIHAARI